MSSVPRAARAGRAQATPLVTSRPRWTLQEDELLLSLAEKCMRADGSPNWVVMYALPEARYELARHMPPGGATRDNSKHFYKRILKLAAGASTAEQGGRACAIMKAVKLMRTKPAAAGAAKRRGRAKPSRPRAAATKPEHESEEAAIVAQLQKKAQETAALIARLQSLCK